jgi:hypothetical protein
VTRTRCAAVVLALPASLVLGACAGLGGAEGATGEPVQPASIAAWSEPAGIAPGLVYVTDVEGFELATQSVGVFGDDGMSAVYMRSGAAMASVMLTTSRDPAVEVVPCAGLPDSSESMLRCATERDGVHIVLDGEGVDAATLRAAAEAVRVPGADELEHLFSDVPTVQVPVERGDLPAEGDGAPLNEPGLGG